MLNMQMMTATQGMGIMSTDHGDHVGNSSCLDQPGYWHSSGLVLADVWTLAGYDVPEGAVDRAVSWHGHVCLGWLAVFERCSE